MFNSFRAKIQISMLILVVCISSLFALIMKNHVDQLFIEKEHRSSKELLNTMKLYLKKEKVTLDSYKELIISKRKEQLEHHTDLVRSYFEDYYDRYKSGEYSLEEAKRRALEGIRKFSYGNNEYFFIFDTKLTLLSHPNPKLIGINANKVTDKKGKFHIKELMSIALKEGSSTTFYYWPRLNSDQGMLKLGYSEIYQRWNWLIVSGIYIDDVEKEVETKYRNIIKKLEKLFNDLKNKDNSDYYFLVSGKGNFLIHPTLKGQNAFDLKNEKVIELFKTIKRSAQDGDPHEYEWRKGNDKSEVYKKVAFVDYVKELDWYVAKTVYKDELHNKNKIINETLIYMVVLMILISSIISYYLANNLSYPINKITSVLEELKFDKREVPNFPLIGSTETVKLSKFLTEALESLSASYSKISSLVDELKEHKNDLEKQVSQRTQELDGKNVELQKALDEMNNYKDKLVAQGKLASLGAVTSGIAHEMKNPLNLILNSSKMLEHDIQRIVDKKDPNIDRILKACSIIDGQSSKADSIIKNMLSLSTSATNKKDYIDLKKYIETIIEEWRAKDNLKGKLEISSNLEEVEEIKVCLKDFRTLLNVFYHNSIYSLKLVEAKKENLFIDLSLESDKSNFILVIKDNGLGVDSKVSESIFNPFFTTKPPGEGSGLGLSLAHDVVTSMDGRLELVQDYSDGAAFKIVIPKSSI